MAILESHCANLSFIKDEKIIFVFLPFIKDKITILHYLADRIQTALHTSI